MLEILTRKNLIQNLNKLINKLIFCGQYLRHKLIKRKVIQRTINSLLSKIIFFIHSISNSKNIKTLIKNLQIYEYDGLFERIGDRYDGGYLLPKITKFPKYLISGGIGHTYNFEKVFADKNTKVLMYDFQVDSSNYEYNNINFFKKNLGNGPNAISLNNIFEINNIDPKVALLKMDIEGAEYDVLDDFDEKYLKNLPYLVIEFHLMNHVVEKNQKILKTLNKINKHFKIIHIHPCNNRPPFTYFNLKVFPVLEITFCNKKNKKIKGPIQYTRKNLLDKRCIKSKKEIVLPKDYFSM